MGQPAGHARGIGRLTLGRPDEAKVGPATTAAHIGRQAAWTQARDGTAGVVNTPVWRASTVLYPTIADMDAALTDSDARLFYGRKGTPTHWALREALDSLEPGAAGTMLYPSGVAALAGAILSVVGPGDHLLIPDSAYDPTTAMAHGLLKRMGVKAEAYDPMIGAGIAELFRPETRLLLLESPGSLTFEVQDVPAVTAAARQAGVVTLLDNTWGASWFFKGISAGCDLVMQALTKYVGGHSDLIAGGCLGTSDVMARIAEMRTICGTATDPHTAWLLSRSLETLHLRMERSQDNARVLSERLRAHDKVTDVLVAGGGAGEQRAIFEAQCQGPGSTFSIRLKGGEAEAFRMLNALRLFKLAVSLGGSESLASHPSSMTHSDYSAEAKGRCGIGDDLVRLSVGVENVEDLWVDLEQALAAV